MQSLGGRFVELPIEAADAQDAGGYAKAQDESFYQKQRELLGKVVAESDVVITTAVVPGKKSPVLVTKEMVGGMALGSVIVDLAAERGGNCELTRTGETIVVHGVTIIGAINLASAVPYHASQMYAKNLTNFLVHLVKDGKLQLNLARRNHPQHAGHAEWRNRESASAGVLRIACLSLSSEGGNLVVTNDLLNSLYVFILAAFIGFEVIRRVSPLLHTPLMSLTNALDAIAVVGAIILAGEHKSNARGHAGHHRHRRGHQQYRWRLHHYRPHAQDVQIQPDAETMIPGTLTLLRSPTSLRSSSSSFR